MGRLICVFARRTCSKVHFLTLWFNCNIRTCFLSNQRSDQPVHQVIDKAHFTTKKYFSSFPISYSFLRYVFVEKKKKKKKRKAIIWKSSRRGVSEFFFSYFSIKTCCGYYDYPQHMASYFVTKTCCGYDRCGEVHLKFTNSYRGLIHKEYLVITFILFLHKNMFLWRNRV